MRITVCTEYLVDKGNTLSAQLEVPFALIAAVSKRQVGGEGD